MCPTDRPRGQIGLVVSGRHVYLICDIYVFYIFIFGRGWGLGVSEIAIVSRIHRLQRCDFHLCGV